MFELSEAEEPPRRLFFNPFLSVDGTSGWVLKLSGKMTFD